MVKFHYGFWQMYLRLETYQKMFRVFPQSLKSKVSKNFEPLNQHQMEQFLSVLTKYRNVCAHGERLFTYRTVDAIADTPLHKNFHYHRAVISTKKENKICLLW